MLVDYSGSQEDELVALAKANDEGAFRELVSRFQYLIDGNASQYFLLGADKDDIKQEAMIGLLKAIRTYDPERGQSLRGFAGRCVGSEVLTAVKAHSRKKHRLLNDNVVDIDGLYDSQLPMTTPDEPYEYSEMTETFGAIRDVVESVSELERGALVCHMLGDDYDEIGDIIGVNHKSVDNALTRVRRRINIRLGEEQGGGD